MKINTIGHLVKTNPIQTQSNPIKPNLPDAQMSVNSILTKDYERNDILQSRKTNPIQTQFKPNFRKPKMNINSLITKDYERNDIFAVPENKPNSNPIKPCPERSRMGRMGQFPKVQNEYNLTYNKGL